MTRKFKERFMKYFKSKALWSFLIFCAKRYNDIIRLVRIFSWKGHLYWPAKVRDKWTKARIESYNTASPKQAANYYKIYDAHRPNIIPPKTIEKTIHPWLLQYAKEPQYESFVATIPDGKVIWTYTNLTPNNEILWDCARYPHEDLYSNIYTYKPYLGEFKKVNLTVAVVSGNDTFKNYCHWMYVALPRLHLFQKSWLTIDKFAIDYNTPYHKDSMKALGIGEDKLLITSPETKIQAKTLIVGSTPSLCGNFPQRTIDFLRSTFLDKPEQAEKKGGKRIFLSRVNNGKTNNRKVENEQEIFEYLETLWFEKVIMEGLSVRQQAELFNKAEIVIAPHGAGLTNLVFCNPWTKVIELFQEKTARGHFYCLANACKLDYYYVMWGYIKDPSKIEMDRDMHISLKKLKATLKLAQIID